MEPVSASNIRLLPRLPNTVVLLRDWRLNYQELDCKAFLVFPMDKLPHPEAHFDVLPARWDGVSSLSKSDLLFRPAPILWLPQFPLALNSPLSAPPTTSNPFFQFRNACLFGFHSIRREYIWPHRERPRSSKGCIHFHDVERSCMESLVEMIDRIRELIYWFWCKKFVVVETFQCQGLLAFPSRWEANERF